MTRSGTVSGAQRIGVAFRAPGAFGSFLLRSTAPVVGGRFRLEIGSYEMLLFKSADGVSFQSSFSPAATIQVF